MFAERASIDEFVSEPARRYLAVKRALAGISSDGRKIGPGIGDRGVICLAQGNGMRRPHSAAVLAGVKALLSSRSASLEAYASQCRDIQFDRAIVALFRRLGIPGPTARTICIDSGLTRLLAGFFFAVGRPSDVFLVNRAYYHGFASLAEACHVKLMPLETRSENGYKVTADDLHAYRETGGRACGLILVQPTFTGETYEAHELRALVGAIQQSNLRVFCDMTFAGTEHDGDFYRPTLASIGAMSQRTVTAMSGSKAFGLANTRIGWACGPLEIIQRMNFYATATGLSVPQIAKSMATAALQAPESYLLANAREADRRKRLLLGLIDRVNAKIRIGWDGHGRPPALTVERIPRSGHSLLVSFEDFRGFRTPNGQIRNSLDIARYLLKNARVAVSPCYSGGIDHCLVRIAFGDLGASATHAQSMRSEAVLLRQVLLGIRPRSTPAQKRFTRDRPNFAVGRRLLRIAMVDRIAPALLHLAASQTQGPQRTTAHLATARTTAPVLSSNQAAKAA